MEECPLCHGQVIGCDCPYDGDDPSGALERNEKAQNNVPSQCRELLERIEPELSGYTVYLETESGRFLPLASKTPGEGVVGLIITYIRDGLSPRDTEQPVKQLAQRLSARLGKIPPVLLSRSLESFVGYYVRLRP
jgi:hypothetical protein